MDGATMVGGIIGFIIGIGIGGLIGALLIMLGTKIVMGSTAKFGSAFLAAIVSAVVGFIIGFVLGFAFAAVSPSMAGIAQIVSLVAGIVVTPFIYSAMVTTGDGRKPTYVQGLLVYLIQLAILIALGVALVMLFHVPIPGMSGY